MNKRRRLTLVLLLIAALWLFGLNWFTRSIQENLPPEGETADAVVALTGGTNRIDTAFDLLADGRAHKLFISGVYRGVEVRELMDQWKKESPASLACCVVLGFEADNTIGNARETSAWLKRESYHSIILVTANYHMKRAIMAFTSVDPDIKIIPYPVQPDGLDMATWWRNPSYRSLIVREYMKYLASVFVYAAPGNPL